MSGFTQGPWVAVGGEVLTADYEYEGQTICDHICNCEVINGESPNAKLIAAAPELLEACLRMRNQLHAAGYEAEKDSMNPTKCLLAQVEGAIGKALEQ